MKRRDHRHLGRVPGDRATPTGRELGEPTFELLHELVVKPELDRTGAGERAVGLWAGDEDRLHMSVPIPANAGHRELLVAAELVLLSEPARYLKLVAARGDSWRKYRGLVLLEFR
jgi:hypothetical protein